MSTGGPVLANDDDASRSPLLPRAGDSSPFPPIGPVPSSRRPKKRHRREELSDAGLSLALDQALDSKPNAELAVLHLIEHYQFELEDLMKKIQEKGLHVSFSKVTYSAIASRVGLDPSGKLRDIVTFDLERARIPKWLFKKIIKDMHMALNQYGPPDEHHTEEARSRFLAPLMNRLVAQFRLLIQNTPESIMPGRMATKARIEYQFKVCGALTVLFVEVKLQVGSSDERLNAIGQVIAEADACDFMNSKLKFHAPLYAVLCDGKTFDFFTFSRRTTPPTLSRGLFLHADGVKTHGPEIPTYEKSTRVPFIKALRPICETFYAIFLRGYVTGLKAYLTRSQEKALGEGRGRGRESTPAWVVAVGLGEEAMRLGFVAAEMVSEGAEGQREEIANLGFATLQKSVDATPSPYNRDDCDLMEVWDDSF